MHPLLAQSAHRSYPLPRLPWALFMRWRDLLFLHRPLDPEALRPFLPEPLRPHLDTHDGRAWLGVIPFHMDRVRLRGLPPLPFTGAFAELNVRTYVTVGGKPGVYFFSLDAASLPAVHVARFSFFLNYLHAGMDVAISDEGEVEYRSERLWPPRPARFEASYRPQGEPFRPAPGSLEHFLVERYCLYTVGRGRIWRGNIHHAPWELQLARAEVAADNVAQSLGLPMPDVPPLAHFARVMEVLAWLPEKAG